ncbi:DUF1254 domain-containing protein [Lysobacter sp. KIS68-7]|uniref:DUF1254 domain-containing protein n=1 Tax=Lysobacter sp. KIS68-7 TaxID=2904252 RepID=UPI001E2833D8|nr:DUF1254 domain-containing protein [Lysobacter sp. KIS68-7]UHQ19849.1 DUF1254 domain-containing protein [Lysobacter sp. KIS68-7]
MKTNRLLPLAAALLTIAGCNKAPETAANAAATAESAAKSVAAAVTAATTAVAEGATEDTAAIAAVKKGPLMPVTVDNFARAETDSYFANTAVKDNAFSKLLHHRELMGVDQQFVVRGNRDTLYSIGVFDLDAGPVTITMPDPGKRFQALQIIDEDEHVPNVYYGAGTHTLTRKDIGTRYVATGIRTLVNPDDPEDVKQANALQDKIVVKQDKPGTFEIPNWDPVSQKKIRDALLTLSESMPDTKGAFGPRGKVDPVRHLVASASAWGGNPEKDALYLNVTPEKNDGKTIYKLSVKDVPVDGFWSISVYNAKGYYEKNDYNAYTLNNITAKKNADGGIDIQFGGCDGKIPNCLPIAPGWNYMVRLYRSKPQILDGTWKFPEAQPVG